MSGDEFFDQLKLLFMQENTMHENAPPKMVSVDGGVYNLINQYTPPILQSILGTNNVRHLIYSNGNQGYIIAEMNGQHRIIEYARSPSDNPPPNTIATESNTILIGINGGIAIPGNINMQIDISTLFTQSFELLQNEFNGDRVRFECNDRHYTTECLRIITVESGGEVTYRPVIHLDAKTEMSDVQVAEVELALSDELVSRFNPGLDLLKKWGVMIDTNKSPSSPPSSPSGQL